MIESSQNQLIKLLGSLHSRAGREKSGLFLLEGVRLVEAALDAEVPIRHAVYSSQLEHTERGMDCLRRLAVAGQNAPQEITDRLLCALTDTERPQGLLVAAEMAKFTEDLSLSGAARVLVVDGVQDPGNLGTIIRTADAFGVQSVITLTGTVDVYNEKVVRAAMGSLFHVRLQQAIPAEVALIRLRQAGLQLVVSSLVDAVAYNRANYGERVALVVGNEGAGVSGQLLQAADLKVVIPIPGQAESLNVAVATGIMLAELSKH